MLFFSVGKRFDYVLSKFADFFFSKLSICLSRYCEISLQTLIFGTEPLQKGYRRSRLDFSWDLGFKGYLLSTFWIPSLPLFDQCCARSPPFFIYFEFFGVDLSICSLVINFCSFAWPSDFVYHFFSILLFSRHPSIKRWPPSLPCLQNCFFLSDRADHDCSVIFVPFLKMK